MLKFNDRENELLDKVFEPLHAVLELLKAVSKQLSESEEEKVAYLVHQNIKVIQLSSIVHKLSIVFEGQATVSLVFGEYVSFDGSDMYIRMVPLITGPDGEAKEADYRFEIKTDEYDLDSDGMKLGELLVKLLKEALKKFYENPVLMAGKKGSVTLDN